MTDDFDDDVKSRTWLHENDYLSLLPSDSQFLEDASESQTQDRLKLLYSVGLDICEQTTLDDILPSIRLAIPKLVKAERFFIATTNGNGDLEVRTCGGIELGDELSDWPISQTMLNRVLHSGRALLVANALQDRDFADVRSVHEHGLLSVMCVPLGQDPCLGVAYVDNQSRQQAFSRQDLVFLAMLGHFVFIALRNAIELDRVTLDKRLGEAKFVEIQQALLRESEIVGDSPHLLAAFNTLQRGAKSDATLLLLGEMGTGKEVFARAAHRLSPRSSGPFVARNCAAIPVELLESELLGYEAGAFTSAHKQKHGAFDLAKGGTLFLDEIGELPLELQPKLLRVLETGEYTRLGGTETHRSDVRMVFATNANLEAAVQEGRFRPDLFFRINTLDVNIPPLRKRTEDIPLLCEHFLRRMGKTKQFTDAAYAELFRYDWPGNIRELRNFLERLCILCSRSTIDVEDIKACLRRWNLTNHDRDVMPASPLKEIVEQAERTHIETVLEYVKGNNEAAIDILKISRSKYWDRLRRYGFK